MSDSLGAASLPGIVALPPSTVRQIGSSQVLVDPSSVVKELIDNALDGRATAVFVDIVTNTIDSIQVKDNGHGIPAEDRALVCRRYCTSKIRDFLDLREVGGKWLGFRGEAMASMAEMSGTIEITTRVEGERAAVLLKYGRDGELVLAKSGSHPVGTTVKITDFFKSFPVRKQDALKHSSKWLAKIRRLMQSYAFARPTVRFGLRVLKAKSDKVNFTYAPKPTANVEDVAFKVIGRECASQCEWTALETDGYEIHAFLPKPTASAAMIANEGAFLSIDSRPVSTRGTSKQIVAKFKERLRKANLALASVKDPFICLNIICPPDSYDPNIEPAKDDVLFEDEALVVSAVDKLLQSFYPEAPAVVEEDEPSTSAQQPRRSDELIPMPSSESFPVHEDSVQDEVDHLNTTPRKEPARWRSNMYGIDEEDLDLLSSENQPPVIEEEEEEERRSAAVSNPWTIAKMNATIKPRKSANNGQLMTPAKSRLDAATSSSSPSNAFTSPTATMEPLSRQNVLRSRIDDELERSIQRLSPPYVDTTDQPEGSRDDEVALLQNRQQFSAPSPQRSRTFSPGFQLQAKIPPSEISQSERPCTAPTNALGTPLDRIPVGNPTPRRSQRKQHPFKTPSRVQQRNNASWSGQPTSGPDRSSNPPPRAKKRAPPPFQARANSSSPLKAVMSTADRQPDTSLFPENINNNSNSNVNSDIRTFFGANRATNQRQRGESNEGHHTSPSFAPVNSSAQDAPYGFRASKTRTRLPLDDHPDDDNATPEPRNIVDQLRPYADREAPSLGPGSSSHTEDRTETPDTPAPSSHFATAGPSRRRSTNNRSRRRSTLSHLPLERTPPASATHTLTLTLGLSIPAIAHLTRTLDMAHNSAAWGCAAEDAYDELRSPGIMRDRVLEWVGVIDGVLGGGMRGWKGWM
ncbi:hypothetical protein BDV95DRAFT_596496 [Massariosphaeria phaeospora]|uniref:DNA mismatch repair protein S5 domain-containing protein n=1 Tax=Massariosphaeria phaeospora TaxID=100035 RepID=A0A7C8MKQ8_9PLEO|nr:hypothetical protein BDV95DRAFT_596496 [Massariosphaeria phaeospora]